MIRWRLSLENFDYEIVYKPGKLNNNADCLSRIPRKNSYEEFLKTDLDSIKYEMKEQQNLPEEGQIVNCISLDLKNIKEKAISRTVLLKRLTSITDVSKLTKMVTPIIMLQLKRENFHKRSTNFRQIN